MLIRLTCKKLINSLLYGLLVVLAHWIYAATASETQPFSSKDSAITSNITTNKFYVDDIKATMQSHVDGQLDSNGLFHVLDDKNGEDLALKFVKVHDPVRQIRGSIYFACTDFHVVGEPDKLYDIDFWMDGKTGELIVYAAKVHKEPRWSLLYGWYKQPRYTFVNDEINYLY
jgi:hypothetical protein